MSARQTRPSARNKRNNRNNPDLPLDIYLRISLDPENDEEGVQRQERQCRAWAKDNHVKIGKVLSDNDISAHDENVIRPGYNELIERIKNRESGGVICYHIKRLLRRVRLMEDWIELVEATGAKVITLKSTELDLNTAAGRAVARIFAALAAMESEETAERLESYFYDLASRGKVHRRGNRPFGFKDDWITHDPTEARAYRELFDLVIKGHSLNAIAARWEKKGLVDRNGNRYSAPSLRSLIGSPRARGAVKYQGEVLEDVVAEWKPIVTPEKQAAAIDALKLRRTALRGTGNRRRPARLLSSFVVCDEKNGGCGTNLRVHKSGDKPTYACDKANARGCGHVRIEAELLEEEVEKRLLARLVDPKTKVRVEQVKRSRPDLKKIGDEIAELKTQLGVIDQKFAEGTVSPARWQRISEPIQKRIDDAQARFDVAAKEPSVLSYDVDTTIREWSKLSLDEKRSRIGAFVERVRVRPLGGKGGRNFQPSRVEIDFR